MSTDITIPAPYVPFPGGRTQSHFMRTAAKKIGDSRIAGGSNVTAAVVKLLTDAANALEAAEQVQLDAEAYELSKAHGQGDGWAGFAFMAPATQEHWRRVARKSRELHGTENPR